MECPACQTALPLAAVFCVSCGLPVSVQDDGTSSMARPESISLNLCAACDYLNAPISRYCTACGMPLTGSAPIATDQDPPSSFELGDERRTVTVFHADVCGFTRIAERLSPEQTKTLVDALFQVVHREIVAMGGRVDAYIGDAVLAVFGVPISHGDDPRRAVEAGLALHRMLARFSHPLLGQNETLKLRIGIDTGPVVVGRIGAVRRTTITGATVAAAMELERSAPAGGTLVGEATRRLVPEGYHLTPSPLSSGRQAYVLHDIWVSSTGESGAALHLPQDEAIDGPATIQLDMVPPDRRRDLIRARIDSLTSEERRLIKAAAVAGMYFWEELLERLGIPEPARALAALEAHELVQACALPQLPGTNEMRFTSELIREVAYDYNLIKVRRFSHRVVAAWLAERVAGNLEFVPLLAHHHAAGGDVAAAAEVLMAAAQRLITLHALDEAIARYREALALLEQSDSPEATRLIEPCREALESLESRGRDLP